MKSKKKEKSILHLLFTRFFERNLTRNIEKRKEMWYTFHSCFYAFAKGGFEMAENETMTRPDLVSMTFEELTDFTVTVLKQPKFRASQIADWIRHGAFFSEMTNLPGTLITALSENAWLSYPTVAQKFVSQIDGTVKFLYRMHDGEYVESVVMQYEHGYSICLSTQAGCRMGCRFCASTIGGRVRNLLPGEILGQILVAERNLSVRISNIVLMGIGEPLDNYDNVIRFLRLVNSEKGLNIGYRHISLSTCGLVDQIYRLAEEDMPLTLSISLHAASDTRRSEIMPVNKRYALDALLTACREYFDKTGRRISFEYTLIAGQNDSKEDAKNLAALLKRYLGKRPFHVNLIPVNEVNESGFKRGNKASVLLFAKELNALSVNATVRRTLGADINASCGQLRHNAEQSE